MSIIRKTIDIMAIVQARFQCQLNIHFIIYCFFFFIGADHFWMTVLYTQNQMVLLLKWFDPSYPVYGFDPKILLCFVMPMVCLPVMLLVCQIYVALWYRNLKFSTLQKYATNLIGTLGMLMSTGLMLTVVRVCITILKEGEFDIVYYLAWFTIVLYTAVLVPFYGIFLTDLSSSSGLVYSSLTYINFERLMPLMRLALCYAKIFQELTDVGFIYSFLPISLVFFFKEPILHYRYDQYFRAIQYGTCWILVVRSVANIYDQPIGFGIGGLGCPIFIIFIFWCVDIRIMKIMQKEKPTMKQIKILISFLNDFQENLNHVIYFLLNHKKICQNPECKCQNLDISQKAMSVQSEIPSWYEFLQDIILMNFNYKQLNDLPISKKRLLLGKLADLSIVQADQLAKKLHRENSALYLLQKVKEEADIQNFYCLHFRAYYQRYIFQMENAMIYNCKQAGTINMQALKYYEYQKKIENLVLLMRKSTVKHQLFWNELSNQPDVSNIIQYIRKAYQSHIMVEQCIKDLKINSQVQSIVFPIYFPYFDKVVNKEIPMPQNKNLEILKLSQNMRRFSVQSKTAVCLVNLNNSEDFGTLIHSNLFFQQLTGHSCQSRANVDDFILTPLVNSHRQSMTKFIEKGQYFVQRKKVLMKDLNKKIFFTDIIIQIYPSLKDGLNVCVYLLPLQPQSVFISNSRSQIVNYSTEFEDLMVTKNDVQQLDQIFDERKFYQLQEFKQTRMTLRGINYLMKLLYQIDLKESPGLFVISINIALDSEEDQQKNNFQQPKEKEKAQSQKTLQIQARYSGHKVSFLQHFGSSFLLQRRSQLKYNGFQTKQSQKIGQLQQVNEKAKKQRETLQNIFKIVQNNRQCYNVKLWVIFVSIFIILITGLATFNIFIMKQKMAQVDAAKQERQVYQMLNLWFYDGLYGMRMANIEANLNKSQQKFKYYLNMMKNAKNMIQDQYRTLQFKPKLKIEHYQITGPNQFKVQHVDSFVIMEFQMLASQSNLATASINDFNFKLTRKNIEQPLNNFKANFIEANVNGLIGIIPNFNKIRSIKFAQLDANLGKDISKQISLIANPIAILLVILLIIGTILMLVKVKNLKQNSYNLFQKMTQVYITFRKNTVQTYRKQNYPELQQYKQNKCITKTFCLTNEVYQKFRNSAQIRLAQNQANNKTLKQSELNKFKTLYNFKTITYANQNSGRRASQNTGRQFLSNQTQYIVENVEQENYPKNSIKRKSQNKVAFNGTKSVSFQRVSKTRLLCKYFSLFSPLFIYFIACIIMVIIGVNTIITHFQNKDLIFDQIRYAKAIKLYSYQLGLDSGLLSQQQSTTIPIFLNQSMKSMYQTERQIIQKIGEGQALTPAASFITQFNEKNVCESLEKLPNINPNLETSFTKKQCQTVQGKIFLTKGRRAAMMAFLQTARLLLQRNKMSENYTYDQRINYLKNESLKLLSSLDNYFSLIELQFLNIFSKQIDSIKLSFELAIHVSTGICLFFIVLLTTILYKWTWKNLFDDILEIKSIFHMVSEQTIKQNPELQQLVIKEDYRFIE